MYISFQVRIVVQKLLRLVMLYIMRILKSVPIIMLFTAGFLRGGAYFDLFCFDGRYEKIMLTKAVAGMLDA